MNVKPPKDIKAEGGSIVAAAAFIATALITWGRAGWLFAAALIALVVAVLMAGYAISMVSGPRTRGGPGLSKPTKLIGRAWIVLAGGFGAGLIHVLISAVMGW